MKITAKKETSLLELLKAEFPETSVTKLKKVIQCGCVHYKGASVKHPEFVLQKGDAVEYTKYEAKRTFRERSSVPVLFEDGDMLVSFKSAGTPLTGKNVQNVRALNNSINAHLTKLYKHSVAVVSVNSMRLDESGICVFSKRDEVKGVLKENYDKAKKYFRVWVCGKPERESGVFESYALFNDRGFLKGWSEEHTPETQKCTLRYSLLRTEGDVSLLEIEANQLFENQICMQLMHCGFPVLGDKRNTLFKVDYPFPYVFNYKVKMQHPVGLKTLNLTTSIPSIFEGE